MITRILLVDDHGVFLSGMRILLEKESDMEVLGVARTGQEGVRSALALSPDVILMDISMPDLNGIEATSLIIANCPDSKIVCLSIHSSTRLIEAALDQGASGYVLKDCAWTELLTAVRSVRAGGVYVSPRVAGGVLRDLLRRSGQRRNSVSSLLTSRERRVLHRVVSGARTGEIAEQLGVSARTVTRYRHNIMARLGVRSVAGLTKYAIRHGLTALE